MNEKVEKILREAGIKSKLRDVIKLHGDASYRTYYRVVLENGETLIVMQMPAGKSSASEEITNFHGTHDEPPFINISRFLSSLDLPVPKVIHFSPAEKVILLEDIGNDMLIKFVQNADEKIRFEWYQKAIDLLLETQKRTSLCAEKEKCVAMQRSFDATLFNWEFDHFREYLIEERLGKPMKKDDRKIFEEETRTITDSILKIPYSFVHRDFQSKNLMVRSDGSLVLIDFQDALLGPNVYDLVALLRDSYVELQPEVIERLIKYYYDSVRVAGTSASRQVGKSSGQEAIAWFHLVTIQRKMKDAGRFIYIDRVKKNPNFLQYLPTTLRYINNAFNQLANPQTRKLENLLKTYVPEWK